MIFFCFFVSLFVCLFVCFEKFDPCLGILGSKMGPMPGDPCLVILWQKSKPSQLGGTAKWHIPVFLWVPPPLDILEKNVLRTGYLRKTVLIMNENDLFIPKDFDTFQPKLSVQTNKNVNLLDMSTALKRLGIFFFFSLRWKVNAWIAIMIQKVLHTWFELQTQGALTWKWGTDMYAWPRRPPFHDHSALLAVHKTPISPRFSSQDSTFSLDHKFQEI